MRLLHRSPEPPSLSTWLSLDIPHERELAGELLGKMGREKSLEALLHLHDKEETKREKRRSALRHVAVFCLCAYLLLWILGLPWLHLLPFVYFQVGFFTFGFVSSALQFVNIRCLRASPRQQNIVTALLDYDDSSLIADPLCRALSYYNGGNQNEAAKSSKEAQLKHILSSRKTLLKHILRVLPLLPDDKNALTKEARFALRNNPAPLEMAYTGNLSPEMQSSRTFHADFEIAVIAYFSRTKGRDALSAIRKLAKAKTFSSDGKRVQNAARDALAASNAA